MTWATLRTGKRPTIVIVGGAIAQLLLLYVVWHQFDLASYALYLAIAALAVILVPIRYMERRMQFLYIGVGLSLAYHLFGLWRGELTAQWTTFLVAAALQGGLLWLMATWKGVPK